MIEYYLRPRWVILHEFDLELHVIGVGKAKAFSTYKFRVLKK